MAAKLTRLTHKIAIQLHLVAESCTICSSRSRWPVRKLFYAPLYSVLLTLISYYCVFLLCICKVLRYGVDGTAGWQSVLGILFYLLKCSSA
jgi:hypothetical protein